MSRLTLRYFSTSSIKQLEKPNFIVMRSEKGSKNLRLAVCPKRFPKTRSKNWQKILKMQWIYAPI